MDTVIVVNGEAMGTGDEGLGRKLLGNFIRTLATLDQKPGAIIFYNAGVKLLGEGSPYREELQTLEDAGIELLGCGTCLDHFGLIEKIAVGEVSNMRDIASRLLAAGRVVTL
jgi:selenium metabolism protein YedF